LAGLVEVTVHGEADALQVERLHQWVHGLFEPNVIPVGQVGHRLDLGSPHEVEAADVIDQKVLLYRHGPAILAESTRVAVEVADVGVVVCDRRVEVEHQLGRHFGIARIYVGKRQTRHVVDHVGALGGERDPGRVLSRGLLESRGVLDVSRRGNAHLVPSFHDPTHRRPEKTSVLFDVVRIDDRSGPRGVGRAGDRGRERQQRAKQPKRQQIAQRLKRFHELLPGPLTGSGPRVPG